MILEAENQMHREKRRCKEGSVSRPTSRGRRNTHCLDYRAPKGSRGREKRGGWGLGKPIIFKREKNSTTSIFKGAVRRRRTRMPEKKSSKIATTRREDRVSERGKRASLLPSDDISRKGNGKKDSPTQNE